MLGPVLLDALMEIHSKDLTWMEQLRKPFIKTYCEFLC
jgi:hypothetical protein